MPLGWYTGRIQALESVSFWSLSGHWGSFALRGNGLKKKELERTLKSSCWQPAHVCSPAAFLGKQAEVCMHTCNASTRTHPHVHTPMHTPPTRTPPDPPHHLGSHWERRSHLAGFHLDSLSLGGGTVTLIHNFFLIKKGKITNILKPSALPLTPP